MQKIKIGIIGGAGYTGGELVRILVNHPNASIDFIQSNSNAGNNVGKVHEDLYGETNLEFSAGHHFDVDVIFFCAGHGEAKKFVAQNNIPSSVKLIDIGNDFRLQKDSVLNGRQFVYGLPELNKAAIKKANSIANPGCFATAIQLGLLPLAELGLLSKVYTTGITGSTGAGQALSATGHFSWRANNIQAYKTLTHQHLGEIGQSLRQLQPSLNAESVVNFIPWRGDFARGIFVSSQLGSDILIEELYDIFETFYNDHPSVTVSKDPISLKQVVNTNNAIIQLEKNGNDLVIHSAIDNLLKGASGQAVQNMNLMFGLEERTGLKLKGSAF
ncbi:N-acetyl-gamma-glutamyl-phosphate reductase [Ferruginibacter sp. HRS2-29]|uniref:N-acetyl-gamma-glutamyl-phosphate reductase n=1 Tax=Ferruginibacter sp. HRS2-29 TaxID=2487334 RepID=UPI0020CDD443|nr:N-acetyl-gamma-glutamyl-phosphate reductase [Ferruginibacter sp. HRS2-29]MCP9753377.1 N-acetyl-gamma-glutamyl-phosphate reductase [Ferruginibacter sp. HRS2-29]